MVFIFLPLVALAHTKRKILSLASPKNLLRNALPKQAHVLGMEDPLRHITSSSDQFRELLGVISLPTEHLTVLPPSATLNFANCSDF